METLAPNSSKIPWRLLVIFFFLSAGIVALGYLYSDRQGAHFQREMEAQLNAIAAMQVKQIVFWRQERLHDADSLFDDPIFAREVHDWLEGKGPEMQEEVIINRLKGVKGNFFEWVVLLDAKGEVRLTLPATKREITPYITETALQAVSNQKILFTDLHRGKDNEIELDIFVPLHFHEGGQKINVGVVLLEVNPHEFLYSLIQTWPTPSTTAEFALFRREGNEIVYLNDLRHRPNTALILRTPINRKIFRRRKTVQAKEYTMEELDYRGVPVLAATRKIPDSPWFLTAKIDLAEVTAPLRERFYLVAFLLTALITSSGAGIAYLWRHRDVLYYRQQLEAERKRRDLAQRYEYLVHNANDIIFILDKDLKIIEANNRAISSYGYPREEFLRLHLWDLYWQGNHKAGETSSIECEIADVQALETIHKRKDGTTFPVAIGSSAMIINGNKLYQLIIRDMTKTREKEEALKFLSSRLLIIQENERERISKELHDELGQALVVLKFQLKSINSKYAKANKTVHIDFASLLQYLDGVIEKVRRLSWDFSPRSLEKSGLSATIQNLLEEFGEHYDILWSPEDLQGIDDLFSPLTQVSIYRIFQESLTNIGRHAEASQISVSLDKQEDHISFTVADNGKGFEVNECNRQKPGKCIGLASMQERAQLAGGSLEIRSQPGTGTKIIFNMPIDKEKAALGDLSPYPG